MVGIKQKLVFLDIETLPILPEALKVWPQIGDYPGRTLKADICSIACYGYKVISSPLKKVSSHPTRVDCLWDYPTWKKSVNDDYPLVKALHDLLIDATTIITHNGKKFDIPFINTRIQWHKIHTDNSLTLLPQISHVDTCQIARKHLYLFSNRLNSLGKFLNRGEKVDTGGWDLWVDVHSRDEKAMKRMARYCKQDVNLMSEVFEVLKAHAKDLPNMNLFSDGKKVCPRCSSPSLVKRGPRPTKTRIVQTYQCMNCHHWCQSSKESVKPL